MNCPITVPLVFGQAPKPNGGERVLKTLPPEGVCPITLLIRGFGTRDTVTGQASGPIGPKVEGDIPLFWQIYQNGNKEG